MPPGAPPPAADVPTVTPNSFKPNDSAAAPSIAVRHYDPRTGRYISPDGSLYRQTDLVQSAAAKTWKDMLTRAD